MPSKPNLSNYGDSFTEYKGRVAGDAELNGQITSSLGETTLADNISFNKFEETVRAYVLSMLGYPTVRVELTDFQLKTAMDEAVTTFSYHAPLWTQQMMVFDASAGENLYELPRYVLDNLEYVVYKKSLLTIQAQSNTLEFDFFIKYFQDNFLFSDFSVGEFYMLQSHIEQIRKILSQEGTFDVIDNKYLQLAPFPSQTPDPVVCIYRGLNSDTIHPAYRNWIQRYALATSKLILGAVRSKYDVLPGPGGGAKLDGQLLREEGRAEIDSLKRELLDEFEELPFMSTF